MLAESVAARLRFLARLLGGGREIRGVSPARGLRLPPLLLLLLVLVQQERGLAAAATATAPVAESTQEGGDVMPAYFCIAELSVSCCCALSRGGVASCTLGVPEPSPPAPGTCSAAASLPTRLSAIVASAMLSSDEPLFPAGKLAGVHTSDPSCSLLTAIDSAVHFGTAVLGRAMLSAEEASQPLCTSPTPPGAVYTVVEIVTLSSV